jgi:hypothetical protein
VQLLLAGVLVRREAEDAVALGAQALSLVERKELEVGTLVLLELQLQLNEARLLVLATGRGLK